MAYNISKYIVRNSVRDDEAIKALKAMCRDEDPPRRPTRQEVEDIPRKWEYEDRYKVKHVESGWTTFGSYTTQAAAEEVKAQLEATKPDSTYAKKRPEDLCISNRERKRRILAGLYEEMKS